MRVAMIPIAETNRLYITLVFIGVLLLMIIFYVLIVAHENTLHNIKDKISDCYNQNKLREQQELFEAQYTVMIHQY